MKDSSLQSAPARPIAPVGAVPLGGHTVNGHAELHHGDLARFHGRIYVVGHFFRSVHDGLMHIELKPPPYEVAGFAGWTYVGYVTERHAGLALLTTAPGAEPQRIARLRREVAALRVGEDYRARLLRSIDRYYEEILARPVYLPREGWDDLEALQQVTLGDRLEEGLRTRMARPTPQAESALRPDQPMR